MGLGHVPQEPVRSEGEGADVQGRQRRGAAERGDLTPSLAAAARGRWGEAEAARWYAAHGAEVLDRNWRCPAGELDLVVRAGNTVAFVEVKARADDRFGGGAAAVDHRKQRRVRAAAFAWLAAHDVHAAELRFDVVVFTGTKIEVLPAAF